jgi:hypothetical protein
VTFLLTILLTAACGLWQTERLFAQGDARDAATSADAKPAPDEAAAPRPAKAASKPAKAKNRQPLAITPEREAAVMAFVERNHAELSGLLAHLKENQPKQYEQAVKEIYRITERLAGVQERDPLLYELEVKVWTAQSQVQLLAARLKMGDTQEQRQQLREALAAQIQARLAVLKHQRDSAAQRLARMDEQIGKLETDGDAIIDRQLETLAKAGTKTTPKAGRRAGQRKQN